MKTSLRLGLPLLFLVVLAGCTEGQKANPLSRFHEAANLPEPGAPPDPSDLRPLRRTLYDRLGGEKAIAKVVDDFVALVAADDNLKEAHKKHFRDGDVDSLKQKLITQVGQATGGPQKYTGKNMREAHEGLKVTDADFNALVADLRRALDANRVAAADRDELLGMLEKMRPEVVESP